MNEGGDPSNKIKVVDRRWFTEDGELRADRPAARSSKPPEPSGDSGREGESRAREAETAAAEAPKPGTTTSEAFLELVETLAQQAELFMVGAQGLPKQPEQARRMIDYLGVLEAKTRGNLSAEESQILSNLIFQLRVRFVQ